MHKMAQDELKVLAGLANSRAGEVLAATIRQRRQAVDGHMRRYPQRCDTDLTKDIVFQLGYCAALDWVLSAPEQARKCLEGQPSE
jgi:hypothetical protein